MNAPIEILLGRNPLNPLFGYIEEILAVEGFSYRWVDVPSGGDVLLLT